MSEVTDLSNSSKQKLVSDMKVVVSDAEEILRATAGVAGEKMADLRERIGERLRDAKLRIADAEAALADKTKAAARPTDDYVNENPWQAVGVAVGIGLLLGSADILSFALLGTGLNVAAQLGDFFESALKRWRGVKDSGKVLPGHGGILDRIDSLLFVLPLYRGLASIFPFFD